MTSSIARRGAEWLGEASHFYAFGIVSDVPRDYPLPVILLGPCFVGWHGRAFRMTEGGIRVRNTLLSGPIIL